MLLDRVAELLAQPATLPRTQEIAFERARARWLDRRHPRQCAALRAGSGDERHRRPGGRVASRSGRSSTGSIAVRRVRRLLVGSQFAIATPLLVVAGLLLASLNALRQVDLGFDTHNVVSASVRLPAAQFREPDRSRRSGASSNAACRPCQASPASPSPTAVRRMASAISTTSISKRFLRAPASRSRSRPGSRSRRSTFVCSALRLLQGRLLEDRDAKRPTSNPSSSIARGRIASFRTAMRSANVFAKAAARSVRGHPSWASSARSNTSGSTSPTKAPFTRRSRANRSRAF